VLNITAPQKNSKDSQGFTIIEILIVLAIASLVMLIVFLAVPALQRNSRNNQRKRDIINILGAIYEFTTNNANTRPNSIALNTGASMVVLNAFQPNQMDIPVSYYANQGGTASHMVGTQANTTDENSIILVTSAKCNGSDAEGNAPGVALLYSIETGNGSAPQCQAS
jgi:prepilin-type N-terminal cleavage/methylation domain-containing protein